MHEAFLRASPNIRIVDNASLRSQEILVRQDAVPQGFEQYQRLIELVGTAEDERAHARQRWRHYAERGYQIKRHDVAAKE